MPGAAASNISLPPNFHNNNAYAENSLALAQTPEMSGPFESQNRSETTSALQEPSCSCSTQTQPHLSGTPVDYFNSSGYLVEQQELRVQAQSNKENHQALFLAKQWSQFQSAYENAEAQLERSLKNLEQSWIKGYLLNQEKKIVQTHLCKGLQQIRVVHQAANEVRGHPTRSNWETLEEALCELYEISMAASPAEAQATEVNLPAASLSKITRIWNEVQYFLAPVVVTGWGILNKLGLLTEVLTKDIPVVGGLISLLVTTYQRIAKRINTIKSEDRELFISLCCSLQTAFELTNGKQTMEQFRTQTENTRLAAQQATNVLWEVGELRKAIDITVDIQSQQIAELKIQLAHFEEQNALLLKNQQQTTSMLASIQQLIQKNEAIEKKV